MNEVISFFQANWKDILDIIAKIIAIATVVVKLTPTLKDDNLLLPVIKFIAKYLALNTPTPEKRPS